MTPRKLKLPNLAFRPLALKLAGDQRLLIDVPKKDRMAELYSARLTHRYGGYLTNTDLSELCCVATNVVARWFRNGVRWERGEDLCDQFGIHPVEVWPEYYQILADVQFEFVLGCKNDDLIDDKIMEKMEESNGSRTRA